MHEVLFESIYRFLEMTNMKRTFTINETRRISHINSVIEKLRRKAIFTSSFRIGHPRDIARLSIVQIVVSLITGLNVSTKSMLAY